MVANILTNYLTSILSSEKYLCFTKTPMGLRRVHLMDSHRRPKPRLEDFSITINHEP